MLIQPYLNFNGRCEEAIEFYRKALGAEVILMKRFKEAPPDPSGMCPPSNGDKIMHASLRVGDSTLMASDGRCDGKPKFEGITLSISAPSVAKAESLFAALADGGQVQMPLTQTFFAVRFGMVADRFGVSWMILADK